VTAALKPALTPEEWEKGSAGRQHKGRFGMETSLIEQDGGIYYAEDTDFEAEGQTIQPEDAHAVAALCLNGLTDDQGAQLGFSWEDVDALEQAAANDDSDADEHNQPTPSDFASHLRNLAARIAALLPPRGAK
jgi:hypothetical protein